MVLVPQAAVTAPNAPGPIVSDAPAGYSNHNFGIAFDVGIFNGGLYLDDSPLYVRVGALGRSQGLNGAGIGSAFLISPIFSSKSGCDLAEQRTLVAAGKWEERVGVRKQSLEGLFIGCGVLLSHSRIEVMPLLA